MADILHENHAPAARRVDVEDLRLLTLRELMALTGLGRSTIYAAMAAGRLRKVKIGGSTRFRPADVADYINRASDVAA